MLILFYFIFVFVFTIGLLIFIFLVATITTPWNKGQSNTFKNMGMFGLLRFESWSELLISYGQYSPNKTPHSLLVRVRYGCLSWIQSLVEGLHFS